MNYECDLCFLIKFILIVDFKMELSVLNNRFTKF